MLSANAACVGVLSLCRSAGDHAERELTVRGMQ